MDPLSATVLYWLISAIRTLLESEDEKRKREQEAEDAWVRRALAPGAGIDYVPDEPEPKPRPTLRVVK
jgi:hypothetical protein